MKISTGLVDNAVAAAKSLPDLLQKLRVSCPALADQLTGKPLIASKSPGGTLVVALIAWAVAKLGLGWDADTCDIVGGVGILVGAYIMRYVTKTPVNGLVKPGDVPTPAVTLPLPPTAAVLLLCFALVGCAGPPGSASASGFDQQKGLILACNSFASSLFAMAGLRASGRLSPGVVSSVDQARSYVDPLCTSPTPPQDVVAATASVQAAADQLSAAAAAAKSPGGK